MSYSDYLKELHAFTLSRISQAYIKKNDLREAIRRSLKTKGNIRVFIQTSDSLSEQGFKEDQEETIRFFRSLLEDEFSYKNPSIVTKPYQEGYCVECI